MAFWTAALVILSSQGVEPIDLRAWRKVGFKGEMCASCHSPDGIELAVMAFAGGITRRAIKHIPLTEASIVNLQLRQVRARYGIKNRLDEFDDRPLQPASRPFEQYSPDAQDRAFASSVRALVPSVFESGLPAQAREELLRVDLKNTQIGIFFSRMSEDSLWGPEHSSVADWMPDVVTETKPGGAEKLFRLHDQYLANPTAQNLFAIDGAYGEVFVQPKTPLAELSYYKLQALLTLSHELRHRAMGTNPWPSPGKQASPLWKVADFARTHRKSTPDILQMPPDVREGSLQARTIPEQMKQIRAGWYWAGWMMDPGLSHMPSGSRMAAMERMVRSLLEDGPHPVHAAFALARFHAENPSMKADAQLIAALKQTMPSEAKHAEVLDRLVGLIPQLAD